MFRGLVATIALLALGTLGPVACGDDDDAGTSSFEEEGFPFTFDYPGDLELTDDVNFDQSLGSASDQDLSLGIDDDNGIILQRFTLGQEVDKSNIDLAKREFDGLLAQAGVDASAGETGETAGFPSLEYASVSLTVPEDGESRLIALFEGDQEYLLNCQSTPDERETVDDACAQMLESLSPTE